MAEGGLGITIIRALAASNVRRVHFSSESNVIVRREFFVGGPRFATVPVPEAMTMMTFASASESAARMGVTTMACHDPRAFLKSLAASSPGTIGSCLTQ
jgi:hypothetical protein